MRSVLARVFLNPGLYVGLAISALLVVLAYQVRPSYDIPFGTATDGPLLRGFNAGEQSQGANPFSFRWTGDKASVVLSDVGRQDFDLTLSMAAPRPAGSAPPHVRVSTGNRVLLETDLPGHVRDYPFHITRDD